MEKSNERWKQDSLDSIEALEEMEADKEGFVGFGEVARNMLGMQPQYASYYLIDREDWDRPYLGEDLRFNGDPYDYYFLKIHKDDAHEFVKRVKLFRDHNIIFTEKVDENLLKLAYKLDAIQRTKNEGKGVAIVQSIIGRLRVGDLKSATQIFRKGSDKLIGEKNKDLMEILDKELLNL